MAQFDVAESNSAPSSTVVGSIAPDGGDFHVLGVAFAGLSVQGTGPGAAFQGIYGSLHLNADGSFSYDLDNLDLDTNQLGTGESTDEQFTYTYSLNGVIQTGQLVFHVAGIDEANQSVISRAETLTVTGDLTIADNERYVIADGHGIYASSGATPAQVVINGELRVGGPDSTEAIGLHLDPDPILYNLGGTGLINNGRIEVLAGSTPQGATGIASSSIQTVVNNGVVHVRNTANVTANLDYMAGAGGVGAQNVINNGLIDVTSDHGTVGGVGLNSSVARPVNSIASLINNGVIRVSGNSDDVDPLGIVGVGAPGTRTMIDNRGTIEAISTNPNGHSIGINIFPDNSNVYQSGTIINSGRIVADTAIRGTEGHNVALTITNTGHIEGGLLRDGGLDVVTNAAGAEWIGDFSFGNSADLFRNAGSVTGTVSLHGGGDFFDGRGGSVDGSVAGGAGLDILLGGDGADTFDGGADGDLIEGGGGADRLTGGAGADTFVYVLASDSTAGSSDLITDFQSGVDHIDLGQLAPSNVSLTVAGSQTIVAGTSTSGAFSIAVNGIVVQSDLLLATWGSTITGSDGSDALRSSDAPTSLYGMAGDDTLSGGLGSDLLDGGTGADTLFGGAGDDRYIIDNDNDRILEAQDGGHDQLWSSVDYSLQRWVEDGTLTGTADIGILGNDSVNVLTGNSGNNWLRGAGGDDVLIGMGGADQLEGSTGADRFVYLAASDSTAAATDYLQGFEHGTDIVDLTALTPTSIAFDEFNNPDIGYHWTTVTIGTATGENLVMRLDGHATFSDFLMANETMGTAGADTLTDGETGGALSGLDGDDVLVGGAGIDFLDGGAGADRMSGGAGNDFYFADRPDDLTFEATGGGTDTVFADVGYYLYANVENLVLSAAAGSVFGVGNDLDNTITGNLGDNLLIGGGGADLIHAGAGNDAIFGEDGADQLYGDAGIDYLVGGDGNDMLNGGAAADALYGGAGDDVLWGGEGFATDILVGGDGNDVLHGNDGDGEYDIMNGAAGDDIYYVDTPADLTYEGAGEGTDTVYAGIIGAGYYLYANVENLILTDNTPFGVGNALDNHLTGNAIANYLLGGSGDDVLNGKAGNDVLFGEAGADTFVFEHGTGADVIGDFVAGTDKIDLSAIGYTWAQVQSALHENDGSTAIDLGNGDLVVLNGVTIAQLHQSDFVLSGGSSGSAPTSASETFVAWAHAPTVQEIAPPELSWIHAQWAGDPLVMPTL